MTRASEEQVDVVDELDRVIGHTTRAQMRAQNLLHRCVAILCFDPHGRLYVHQRTAHKDVFPSMYDMTVGGVVGAGEDYAAAARREIGEELGIVGPTPRALFMHRYEGACSRSHTAVFRVEWGGPIVHQPSEVAWGGYFAIDEIVENRSGWQFVPDGWQVFQRFLSQESSIKSSV